MSELTKRQKLDQPEDPKAFKVDHVEEGKCERSDADLSQIEIDLESVEKLLEASEIERQISLDQKIEPL